MTSKGKTRRAVSVGLCAAVVAAGPAHAAPAADRPAGTHWSLKDTGTDVRLRGPAPVSRSTAWVAGSAGTVLRTDDGGRDWLDVSPPGAEALEFRDIEAFDARRAVVLAIGEGEASRVLRTEDGGRTGRSRSATPIRARSTTASRSSTAATGWP
jgi:photosystem II stability/assembly factor-like uncharacterized protein